MVTVPADMPDTFPVDELTAATPALLLVHTPPEDVSVSVVFAPTQMVVVPPIVPALAAGLTVTVAVAVAVPQLFVTV